MAGIDSGQLSEMIRQAQEKVQTQISKMKDLAGKSGGVGIGDMFDMQLAMNKLSQFAEMAAGTMSALNQAINTMARKISG